MASACMSEPTHMLTSRMNDEYVCGTPVMLHGLLFTVANTHMLPLFASGTSQPHSLFSHKQCSHTFSSERSIRSQRDVSQVGARQCDAEITSLDEQEANII